MLPPAHPPPSRTPSPAPPIPTPLTPGPRATALTTLFHTALTHLTRSISLPAFLACFPTPATHTPSVLQGIWAQVTAQLGARASAEFEAICQERDVVAGLNLLERLVGEAGVRRDRAAEGRMGERVAPHLLPPGDLFLAHLSADLGATRRGLEARLEAMQGANEELARGIAAQRGEMEGLVAGLEGVLADVEGVVGAMEVGRGEWRGEVREVEVELGVGVGREAKL